MRSLKKNKQRMFYSLQGKLYPVYQRDDDGNIIYYTDSEGNQIPLETGENSVGYSEAIEFFGNIGGRLYDAFVAAFGTDNSKSYAQLVTDRDEFPDFKNGTLIWLDSEVEYKDEEKTIVDGDSADYVIRGVLKESLNEDAYYLQKLNKEDVKIDAIEIED